MENLITEFLNSETVLRLLHMSITFICVSFGVRATLKLCREYDSDDFLDWISSIFKKEKKQPKTPSYYYEKYNGFFEEDYNEKYWSE